MKLRSITVYIMYRIDAGPNRGPTWKALRARVRELTPHGWFYGSDLVPPTSTNIDLVVSQCLIQLQDKANEILFVFASDLNEQPRRFQDGRYVGGLKVCELQS